MRKNIFLLVPTFGCVVFLILYGIASMYYPGGSQLNKESVGFSWIDNYWCNLLNDQAINGYHNPAKPIALTGLIILGISFVWFWYIFPKYMKMGMTARLFVLVNGSVSMIIALLLVSNINHDLVINLASIFGLMATAGIFVGLYKAKWFGLFVFGLVNIILVGLNNYFYYMGDLIRYLPIVQKITFLGFIVWFCLINISVYYQDVDRGIPGFDL